MSRITKQNVLQEIEFYPYFSFLEKENDKFVGILLGYIFNEIEKRENAKIVKSKVASKFGVGRNRVKNAMTRLQELGLIDGTGDGRMTEENISINYQKIEKLAQVGTRKNNKFRDLLND